MAQHDYVIDNQTAPAFRTDLNNALSAIVTLNGGGTAPSTTYGNMLWYDSSANILKMRNEADDAWINLGTLDQVSNTFQASYNLGFTPVQQGGGTSQGTNKIYIGWDGSNIRAQVDASDQGPLTRHNQTIGIGQTWQNVTGSRSAGTTYQNTTGKPIMVAISTTGGGSFGILEVSVNASTWIESGRLHPTTGTSTNTIIPNNWYYRITNWNNIYWSELR